MRKTFIAIAVGALLVVGATAAYAQTDDDTTETPIERVGTMIADVLADLVDDGTITADQAEAVETALVDAREARHAERAAMHEAFEAALEDGVITADEAADLPERLTDPDGPLADAWADGELTQEELDEARAEFGGRRGHRGPGGQGFQGPAETVDS